MDVKRFTVKWLIIYRRCITEIMHVGTWRQEFPRDDFIAGKGCYNKFNRFGGILYLSSIQNCIKFVNNLSFVYMLCSCKRDVRVWFNLIPNLHLKE